MLIEWRRSIISYRSRTTRSPEAHLHHVSASFDLMLGASYAFFPTIQICKPQNPSRYPSIMLSALTQPVRVLSRKVASESRLIHRRWAQVHDVRFLATHRDPKTVLEKYKSKLDQKAKE